ncbi:hypothetical protein [Candidatus Tisiphia endosymbiont of Piscicola geometra]|uniref:hypothetical protein n=1 Tax=Candidatus Tisiphia endosymbiont of Piscicola geometra TaxID=3066273 RepID=UPI00312C98F5
MAKQHIQELLRQQEEARHSINKESYYYNETISTKHRTHILCVNAEPYYTYHTERRFNQDLYNQHTAASDAKIINLEAQINALRQQEAAEQARQQAAEKARQEAAAEQARQQAEKARLEALEQAKQAAEKARLAAIEKAQQEEASKAISVESTALQEEASLNIVSLESQLLETSLIGHNE